MPDLPSTTTIARTTKAPARPGLFASNGLFGRWTTLALDLIFPPRCAGCGRVDTLWCERCTAAVTRVPFIFPRRAPAPLAGVAATGTHIGRLQGAVVALKYENGRALAVPLGARLAACLLKTAWTIDMIVPVPLHTSREKERGYNQANLLAQQLSTLTMIDCSAHALTRQRHTTSQVGLTAQARRDNVRTAFSANPALVGGRSLLIIDDVLTTGSTLAACADAALQAGALQVYGLTVTAARQ